MSIINFVFSNKLMNSSKKKTDLKDLAKVRFMEEMLQPALQNTGEGGIVLILDEHTSAVLANIIPDHQLIYAGVTCIQKIEQTRAAFKWCRAFYFIAPSRDNIDRLQEDFGTSRLYKSQHLYFSRRLPEQLMTYLATKAFAKRLSTIIEINLDFMCLSGNVFGFMPGLQISAQADALVSVISCHKSVGSVEMYTLQNPNYTKAKEMAKVITSGLKVLMPHYKGQDSAIDIKLFILERTADMVTPLMHDMHYESMMADLFGDELDVYPSSNKAQQSTKTAIDLNDEFYKIHRYDYFTDILNELPNAIAQFKKENPTAASNFNKDSDIGLAQMQSALKGLPEFNQFLKSYKFNTEMSQRIMDTSKSDEIIALADLEKTVATAIEDSTIKIDAKIRTEQVKQYLMSQIREENKLRLALISLGTVYIDVNGLREYLAPSSQAIFDRYAELVSKYGKLVPESSKDAYRNVIKERLGKEGLVNQRYISPVQQAIQDCVFKEKYNNWDRETFEGATKSKQLTTKNDNIGKSLFQFHIKSLASSKTETLVIVYFVDGVSYSEVGWLARMEKNQGTKIRVLVGSDQMLNPRQFIDIFVMSDTLS